VGFFPGLVAGALVAAVAFCLLGRPKSNRRQSGSSFGNISEPRPSGAGENWI
jgi:hypothetical protein